MCRQLRSVLEAADDWLPPTGEPTRVPLASVAEAAAAGTLRDKAVVVGFSGGFVSKFNFLFWNFFPHDFPCLHQFSQELPFRFSDQDV